MSKSSRLARRQIRLAFAQHLEEAGMTFIVYVALKTDRNPFKVTDSVSIGTHACLLVSVCLLGGFCASRGWGRNPCADT